MIAYIPREKNHYSSAQYKTFKSEEKTGCLQQLYGAAIKDLIRTQSDGSLNNIEFHLGSKHKTVNLKIPLMFIIGDIQGGDGICGRAQYYGKTARRISRMCDAGPEQLGLTKSGMCKRLKMQDVMDYVTKDDVGALNGLY